jgi:branched-chain amino acid transport system permease protein
VFGLALLVMSIFRPQGLLPSRRRAVELEHRQEEAVANV